MPDDKLHPDKIDAVFEEVDKTLIDAINKYDISFIEIDVVLLMLTEKVNQQKTRAYIEYMQSEELPKKDASDIYR